MFVHQLTNAVKYLLSLGAVAAGTGDVQTGAEVDMQGFEAVTFVCLLGTVTATGVATLTAKNSNTSGTYGAGTIDSLIDSVTSTLISAVGVAADSNLALVLDVFRPPKRYIRPQIQRATANVVIVSMLAIVYNGQAQPVTQTGLATAGLALTASPTTSAT